MANHVSGLEQLHGVLEQGGDIKDVVMKMIVSGRDVAVMLGRVLQSEQARVAQVVSSMSGLSGQNSGGGRKGIMEFKVIQNLKSVTGDKSGFRQWHQKFMSAIGQVNTDYEKLMQIVVREVDLGKDLAVVLEQGSSTAPQLWQELTKDVYKILIDKADGEAYDKIKMVPSGDGMRAYGVLYRWFTDVSGLGLVEQSRRLMHPEPVKREEELSEAVEAWMDKLRRLEAHGDKYKLPAVYKLTALKAMLTGKALEYAELWEADLDKVDEEKAYDELLNKVREYGRKKKLDSSARTAVQQGSDPMDVGQVRGDEQGQSWDYSNELVTWETAIAALSKGKGKGKGFRGSCFNCGETGHPARECPKPRAEKGDGKGKGTGKGFQGLCFNCGEFGHPARECPKSGRAKGSPLWSWWPNPGKGGGGKGPYGPGKGNVWEVDCNHSEQSDWKWEQESEKSEKIDIGAIEQASDWATVKRRCKKAGCGRELFCIDRKINNEVCEVNIPGWEKVRVQVDSGAVDTVVPKETAKAFAIKPTDMSKKGIGFIAANGSKIANHGEKKVSGWTDEGAGMSMRMTCADVKKPLCSVYRMNLGGNVVVFDGDRSYMQNKISGQKTRIRCENGQYVFNMWVQASDTADSAGEKRDRFPEVSTSNRFHVLSSDNDDEEKNKTVFTRRALSH